MTQPTLVKKRKVSPLQRLARTHRQLMTLRRTLEQLPFPHQSQAFEKDLNRLELRLLNLYRLTSSALPSSNQSLSPFRELVLKDRSLSL